MFLIFKAGERQAYQTIDFSPNLNAYLLRANKRQAGERLALSTINLFRNRFAYREPVRTKQGAKRFTFQNSDPFPN